jgi:hypothetical protein
MPDGFSELLLHYFFKSISFGSTDELKESQKDILVRLDIRVRYGDTVLHYDQPKHYWPINPNDQKRQIPTGY